MAWELIEVPGNLNISLQDSTVDVVAAKIDPKLANTLIRQLSQVCPLENLRHVKRVRRGTECDGKSIHIHLGLFVFLLRALLMEDMPLLAVLTAPCRQSLQAGAISVPISHIRTAIC
eukprot:XP_020401379.1 uncharacterized protein LOC103642667 isoform X1 [Zea mays]